LLTNTDPFSFFSAMLEKRNSSNAGVHTKDQTNKETTRRKGKPSSGVRDKKERIKNTLADATDM